MKLYAGLDVSDKSTSICVIDENDEIIREAVVDTNPRQISLVLKTYRRKLAVVGLEATNTANWLIDGLIKLKFPAICIDPQRLANFASGSPIRTDRKDAHTIANALRAGLYKQVHVRSTEAQLARTLINSRRSLLDAANGIGLTITAILKGYGLAAGSSLLRDYRERVLHLTDERPELQELVRPLLDARDAVFTEHRRLDARLIEAAQNDPDVRLLMTVPGVGELTAYKYKVVIDDPTRFKRSADVGAYLGLTTRRHESGERKPRFGSISKAGNRELRSLLYTAAMSHMYLYKGETEIKKWGHAIAARRGGKIAVVAVARKIAVVLHKMWLEGKSYEPAGTVCAQGTG